MLKDEVRTKTYRNAIYGSRYLFKDKVVLDVGCGTGILSLFAAHAGAKRVYGIDMSDIANQAKEIVKANKYENVITIIKGKVEEVELPEKVDVIVSEWMGYFLIYESMLESVLFARNKWLKEDGKMYPSHANMYLTPMEDNEYFNERIDFWKNIYGFDFSPIIPFAKQCAFNEPQVEYIQAMNEISFPQKFYTIDCKTVKIEELVHIIGKIDCQTIVDAKFHGYVSYFDVVFAGTDKVFTLSTSPSAISTHWKQTLFYFDEPLNVVQDTHLKSRIEVTRHSESKRYLTITITTDVAGNSFDKMFHLK